MKALKFNLNGNFAFFKKPDVNAEIYFSYGHLHKVALLGIIGACIGLKGYAERGNDDYPEFYELLKNTMVSIVPNNKNACIEKFITSFNNSTGNASKENGGNLIVTEQLLINPSWDIYLLLNNDDISMRIEEAFINQSFSFIPYLGKNDFLADVENIELLELEYVKDVVTINSLFLSSDFKEKQLSLKELRQMGSAKQFIYKENLPVGLSLLTNHYILEEFYCTNKQVERLNDNVEIMMDKKSDRNLYFF